MGDSAGWWQRVHGRTILRSVAAGVAAIGFASVGNVDAAEPADRGQALYENHCAGCHKTIAHTRDSRLVRNMGQLEEQVDRWQANQKLDWSAQEKAEVAQYLNRRFYKF